MDIYEMIDLHDCPNCGGPGLLDEEAGDCYCVTCMDCGCHTVSVGFASEEDKAEAAEKVAKLWNAGKVISINPGE